MTTASFLATATLAFDNPTFFLSASPHVCNALSLELAPTYGIAILPVFAFRPLCLITLPFLL